MFKFIKAKGPHPSAERQKLQKDLFCYRRTLQHGFPHKPTALAWDPSLRLLCIGTATGAVKVFGRPGVEFYGHHQNPIAVTQAVFLPNQGRVVTLCDDNSLHLWEVNKSSLVEVKSQALEGKLKKISTMCVETAGKHLLLGTEGGNIYLLDLASFTMTPDIIYQDVVMQNVPQDYKLNPGAVEAIFEQPEHPDHILIGYNRGLIVLWNRSDNTSIKTFVSNQQLEALCWHDDGKTFTSSHNDGSYMVWDLDQNKPMQDPVTTYGPFACRAIPKIIRRELRGKPLIVFSGGLPRSSGSDKYTVSVIHDEQHVAFDFTSKIARQNSDSEEESFGNEVIDFIVIDSKAEEQEGEENVVTNGTSSGEPDALVVLAEEELVVIDISTKDWKMINLPYLVSLHASAVTCSQHVSGVPEELWEQLKEAGKAQTNNIYSSRSWPIDGGKLLCSKGSEPKRELLLTGHEDGTVRFWDAGGVTLTPIYKFSTAMFFTGDDLEEAVPDPEDVDDDWPPFRKIGVFDPYSDDPRLAVKKVVLCPLSGSLIVAGTAGHVVVAKFDTEVLDGEIKVTTMNIVSDRDGFVWKGHNQLAPKQGEIHQTRGFQATSILQLHPPAAVTACVLQADWGLVAAGTAHGLALFDYVKNKPVMVKCTLNPNDLTGAGDTPISRRKSFKKSLRESFRRLRKGRSTRRANPEITPATNSPPNRKTTQEDGQFSPLEAKPVERQIEARPVDDSMSSFVRCLYFARTFLVNVQNTNPTLWAGTNNGTVYTFTITVPSSTKRETDDVTCHIAKEIQLKHRAPVIAIAVLDGANRPLPEPLEVEKGVAPLPDTTQPHRVIIASEEQFKIFTLPAVKAFCKFKLTAQDGARVRRMAFATFSCKNPDTDATHSEIDLLCLTNIGECLVFSIPDLKRQLNAAAIKREDINGISSLVFTKSAEALYLHSSSELQRISLSATCATTARCYLPQPVGEKEDAASDAGSEGERQEGQDVPPLVNGNAEGSVGDKAEEVRENGEETPHNVTVSSSVGDITIDSVKDYLGSGEELNRRISGMCVTKTVTTVINSSQDGAVTSSSTTTTTTSAQDNIIESDTDGPAPTLEIKKIQVSEILRAPLALAEELDSDGQLNGDA
ncbi:lethal(2) giant larvae protein homolog 1 isoform X3 [Tribolium castaneum]|uniref:lethal(2) giant larvae protein homolog 1 isoform X3 n=1 Tax=Tribolium castaneum TaxID=7070 RepID=UPI00077DCF85|nr:PREDICTED: lethal(2) giant larvae protein homolog 1 isoform X3 [Tribolium castaneum]|eukprot:XP_015837731.1 PREDICTED: lethal(2) giant larvae protein homolog 1 isoform X3 [Tribolium castaneum]